MRIDWPEENNVNTQLLINTNPILTPLANPKYDVRNFLNKRIARPSDDLNIATLLEDSFVKLYAEKLNLQTPASRLQELKDVALRRANGAVALIELGYRTVGTFSLIEAQSPLSQSWVVGAANLRCVAVDPHYQGFGFSDVLVSWADEIAIMWKVKSICLHVQEGAEALERLYSRHGYVRDPAGDTMNIQGPILGYKKSISL